MSHSRSLRLVIYATIATSGHWAVSGLAVESERMACNVNLRMKANP